MTISKKLMGVTLAASAAAFAFAASASAQDLDPAQAKSVGNDFIKCAAVYGASSDMLANSSDAEVQQNHEMMKNSAAGAQIAALVLYIMAGEQNIDFIEGSIQSQRSTYLTRMQSEGLSEPIKADITKCFGMAELQTTLVDIAKKATEK